MSLVKAERRRLFKRRFTRWMLLFVLLAMGAIVAGTAYTTTKIGPAERAAAEAQAVRTAEEWRIQADQERVACQAAKDSGVGTDRFPPDFDCSQIRGPAPGEVDPAWYLPNQFSLKDDFESLIIAAAALLALFGFVVGASYVGAEWSSGGMMNLLVWRPRRLPVLFTKLATALGGVLAISVVLGAAWTGAFWLIARYRGDTSGLTPGTWESFGLTGARGLGIVLALTAIGFCLASFGRHTAMALGAAIGVAVIGEIGLRIALGMAGVPFADRYMLSTYGLAWFLKSWELEDWRVCEWSVGQCEPTALLITWQDSAIVFGTALAISLVAAFWSIRRRDIT
jgi:hypothetical protein